ncbi:ribokinase [Pseudarthrobacter raffinosi]|uniref:ribokinase n=1 Tax=Pseudarthrobacter raffinosi TaxID=2953651 RepID=UPI00208E3485|nr:MULTISPECIES: ribokinase [unclassified Pseudarthrobacter]MCO4249543.1 ribokinase [Pseudarthrobacter sp. MDT3-9]MCO4261451.1 ribokinase [Pseudarthrobacter sp. MDT3-26]
MSSRVAVIGSINADLTVGVERHPRPGETVLGSGGELAPGGKGGNQALAAARQGAETVMIGAVGSDPHADIATRLLRQEGVDLSHVSVVPGPTGLAIVAVDPGGENNIIVVPGANARLTPGHIAAAEDTLAACAVAVIQGEIPAETIEFASESLGRLGVRQVLNLAPVLDLPPSVLGRSDPLVVNEHEAAQILAEAGGRAVSLTTTDAAYGQELAGALVESGIRSVVVTLGSAGAVLATSELSIHIDAPKVEAADTTGAGDAFVGALAACLARGSDLQSACAQAVRVAAFSVRGHGAQDSYPAASEALPR